MFGHLGATQGRLEVIFGILGQSWGHLEVIWGSTKQLIMTGCFREGHFGVSPCWAVKACGRSNVVLLASSWPRNLRESLLPLALPRSRPDLETHEKQP